MNDIKTFEDLRRKIGSIIGQQIPKEGFKQTIQKGDVAQMGRFQERQIVSTLIAILEYLEEVSPLLDKRIFYENDAKVSKLDEKPIPQTTGVQPDNG